MSRNEAIKMINAQIAAVLAKEVGAAVEVTISESKQRGFFISLFGLPADCDKARAIMDKIQGYGFTDRDTDPDEIEVVDFYAAV